jgi:hypothetical protein
MLGVGRGQAEMRRMRGERAPAEWGVGCAQGHYYTPPLSADDALAYLHWHVADLRV